MATSWAPLQVEAMSAREIKQLLHDHGVDHRGCLEKGDLVALIKADSAAGGTDSPPRVAALIAVTPTASPIAALPPRLFHHLFALVPP